MAHKKSMLRNVPNTLTYLRIILIPVVLILIYTPNKYADLLAVALFLAACITDYLDGYVARVLDQTSSLGQFLDPLADKLLVASVLMVLVELQRITDYAMIPAIIIMCREVLVSGLREYLARVNSNLPVSRLAKWKTTIQMLALGILLFDPVYLPQLPMHTIGLSALWIAGLLTVITGYEYLKIGLTHITKE